MTDVCFVLDPRQNRFFVDLADALCFELAALGVSCRTAPAFPPLDRDTAYVLLPPHEFFHLAAERPTAAQLRRTIFLNAEQPGTSFFDEDVRLARAGAGAVLDINADAVDELRRLGIDARHAPVGWTACWSADLSAPEPPPGSSRDVDVLFLGSVSHRRERVLGAAAPLLARHRSHLVLAPWGESQWRDRPNFVSGARKRELLGRSRVLLNVHVGDRPYFEWLRVVEAICAGVLVVTEPGSGMAPLEAGRHLVTGRPESLALLAQPYVEDEALRYRMARDAWLHLREVQPLARSAELLAQIASDLVAAPAPAVGAASADATEDAADVLAAARATEPRETFPSAPAQRQQGDPAMAAVVKDLRLELLEVRRELAAFRAEAAGDAAATRLAIRRTTASHRAARPVVSVVITTFDKADFVREALDSCAASTLRDIEIVVVDDGSTDASVPTVERWMREHEDVPAILLASPLNRGVGPARNTGVEFARAPYVFMLDADNAVYPRCLERLVETLATEPGHDMAYCMFEAHDASGTRGLTNAVPWDPERFRRGNFVDAMALWRSASLRRLGGYTSETRLYGWEDYDLVLRLAEHGGSGTLVPEILARYRTSPHSMLSITNVSWRDAASILIDRYPSVMAGVEPPA